MKRTLPSASAAAERATNLQRAKDFLDAAAVCLRKVDAPAARAARIAVSAEARKVGELCQRFEVAQ